MAPFSAVVSEMRDLNASGVTWLPNAPLGKATEIEIFFVNTKNPIDGWPGKRSMGSLYSQLRGRAAQAQLYLARYLITNE